ncbi:transposase, partial [Mesorhizobium sp. M2D.F.Ca.ET.160.01.1.1]
RSDNGSPFASAGVTGLTPLAVRFIKLGITLERIAPGKPQQNGRHERFHLTMLPLAKDPEADRTAQGQAFEAFRRSYNEERPHEALAMDTPAQHYRPSQRAMPRTPPEPDYPQEAAVRWVRHNGEIRWNGGFVYVSQSLAGEAVAATEAEDGQWAVTFHDYPLGIIDTRR